MKVAGERQNAHTLLGYIQSDLELEDYRKNPEKLLENSAENSIVRHAGV